MDDFPSRRRKRAFKIQRQMNYGYGSYGFAEPIAAVPSDDIPAQFTFTDVTGQQLSSTITSNTITVSGINIEAAVTITGGTYSKNGGAYTGSAGVAVNGDQFSVRVTSSASVSTAVNAVLTIGGVSDTFTATTGAITKTQTFSDDFTRANENVSANANWTLRSGVATGLTIATNRVAGTNGNATHVTCPDSGTLNSYTSCEWRQGLTARGYMTCYYTNDSNQILIEYKSAGTAYSVELGVAAVYSARITAAIAFSAGQIIELRRFNNVLSFFVDGVQVGSSYTMTAPEIAALTGTGCGLRNASNAATFADTFKHGTLTIA